MFVIGNGHRDIVHGDFDDIIRVDGLALAVIQEEVEGEIAADPDGDRSLFDGLPYFRRGNDAKNRDKDE